MRLASVTDIRGWSGASNGRFHLDFLGVRTDCAFFSGLTPAKLGRLKTSLPQVSDLLVEYEACALAASAANAGFSLLEIGASWGVWTARGAAIGRALGVPVRTVAIEAQPAFIEMMRRHYLTNGMNGGCHHIVSAAAAGQDAAPVWFRFEGRGDVRGRVAADAWVALNAGNPPPSTPEWISLPCRDGSWVARAPAVALKEVLSRQGPFSLIHLRPNSGQSRLIHEGLSPSGVGLVVVPGLPLDEAKAVDAAFAKQGFKPVLALNPGDELQDLRSKTKLRSGMRVAAGDGVTDAMRAQMQESFLRLIGR